MPRGTAYSETFGTDVTSGWPTGWTGVGGGGTVQASDFNVTGGVGTMSVPVASAFRAAFLEDFDEADVDLAVTGSSIKMATGAPIEVVNLATRAQDINTYYLFRARINTDNSVTALIFNPDGTQLDSVVMPGLTYTSGMQLRMRVQSIGQHHRLKLWEASDTEPVFWHLTVVDDSYTGSGFVGVRAGVASGNTNSKPIVIEFDDFASVQVTDYTTDRIPVQVLWAPGADLSDDWQAWPWADITDDVRQASPISITVGRGDEASTTQPASCTLQLNNPDKNYSAYDPASPNYPNVRKGTPIWVLVGPATRFFGYATGFPQSTPDVSGKVPVVSVTAAGTLRRLIQGKSPLRSPLTRAILATNPYAYWPLEDSSGATQGASAVAGGTPMAVTGSPTFGADVNPPSGTLSMVDFSNGGFLSVHPARPASSVTGWRIEFVVQFDTLTSSDTDFAAPVVWTTAGTRKEWHFLFYPPNSFDDCGNVEYWSSTLHGDYLLPGDSLADGKIHHIRVQLVKSGSDTVLSVWVDGDSQGDVTITGETVGPITSITLGKNYTATLATQLVGQVAVWQPWSGSSDTSDARLGYSSETATDRLTRLCDEQGEQITITGDCDTTMGVQGVDNFVNLLRECETTDLGVLYDGLAPTGLAYTTRRERYNRAASLTLDASAGQLAPPFEPVDDDQRVRNLWKVDRKDGSSATVEDTDGPLGTATVGTYDDSVTVNLETDDLLPQHAAWLVHLGTVNGFRYPSLALNLRAIPTKIGDWLNTPLLGRIDVTDIDSATAQHPAGDISLLLEGYTETVGPKVWTVQANVSPFQPWEVWKIGDSRLGRLGAGTASTLHQAYSKGATSIQVDVASGPLWVTTSSKFPFDVNIGGWQVTVTAISGTSSPQTFTVNALPADLDSGAQVTMWKPGVIAL